MREILLLSKRLIKAKEFERIALTNNINFEDLKDNSGLFDKGRYKEDLIKSLVSEN